MGKEEIQLSLLVDMILYVRDPEDAIRKCLDTINSFSRVA